MPRRTGLGTRPLAGPAVFVNELDYDNPGTDTGEALELAAPAGTDLTGWTLVAYNGATGAAYNTRRLGGILPNQQAGFGTLAIDYPTNGLQNGPRRTGSGRPRRGDGAGCVRRGHGHRARPPRGRAHQRGHRRGRGVIDARGALAAADRARLVVRGGDLGGAGAASPLGGEVVTVGGVLVGDFQASAQLGGISLQDPDGEGDPATSDWVFAYASGAPDVAPGT